MANTKFIGGVDVVETSAQSLIAELNSRRLAGQRTILFFANTNFITECHSLRDQFLDEDIIVVNDGLGMDLASWLIHGSGFRENLNGSDLIPRFLSELRDPARVYLLGGETKSVNETARIWSELPKVSIVGIRDGYGLWRDEQAVLDDIRQAEPDMLLVALGNPLQERWILDKRASLPVPIIIGVGALFDFVSGVKKRAPASVRVARLEWLYRLALEPKRLFKRYTLGIAQFIYVCALSGRGPTKTRM